MSEQEEIWKDIKGFEERYQVSNLGRVKSLRRKCMTTNNGYKIVPERILSLSTTHNGYKFVSLRIGRNSKSVRINRAVAIAFIPNPDNKPEVNHIDGNKTNNHLSNLEWSTKSENCRHAYKTGLHKGAWKGKFGKDNKASLKVKQIDIKSGDVIKTFDSINMASDATNIDRTCISRVCRGSRGSKSAGGYKWELVNE